MNTYTLQLRQHVVCSRDAFQRLTCFACMFCVLRCAVVVARNQKMKSKSYSLFTVSLYFCECQYVNKSWRQCRDGSETFSEYGHSSPQANPFEVWDVLFQFPYSFSSFGLQKISLSTLRFADHFFVLRQSIYKYMGDPLQF